MTTHRIRDVCRLCGHADLTEVLSLAPTPPANAFAKSAEEALRQDRYPLTLCLCPHCGHLQLVDVVDPSVLFKDYVYVSGTSPSFVRHFEGYAKSMAERLTLGGDDLVVDIGSNDGTFLRAFKDMGCTVLGVDPAEKIAAEANRNGIETLCDFFDVKLAKEIRTSRGPARLIGANNVFAHIDDLKGVVDGISALLADDGLFVFEVSYFVDVFQNTLFDTIYHEHLDYHRVEPLRTFFEGCGLCLVDVERVPTHGGSLRGYVGKPGNAINEAVEELVRLEQSLGLGQAETLSGFNAQIVRAGLELSSLLSGLKAAGKRIGGYGAPAKATTLMHQFGLGADLFDYVVDDSAWKQGLFTPGLGLPVVSGDVLETDPPDYLVILAWNFADAIISNNSGFLERGGRFIVPLGDLDVRGA